ncbi:MAG: hypothetical protein H7338_07445 [Candidatus Sericytochromatia bacterium]|nr:hypothetical protein [Candidatus Sericytochromatia bacterium]
MAVVMIMAVPGPLRAESRTAATVTLSADDGFVRHLTDAIAVNLSRAPQYARQSGGASWWITFRLVAAEVLVLPAALYFDASSRPFLDRGIGVVFGDFTSMTTINPAAQPLVHRGTLRPAAFRALHQEIDFYRGMIERAAAAKDFRLAAEACHELMGTIEHFERVEGTGLAMTRHIVASVGLSAVHALSANRQSRGETDNLYSAFVGFQSIGLQAGADLDCAVQPINRQGIGIITNDVPLIPFDDAWAAYLRAAPKP